ncbi:type VI secretion system lipoprotein TssJ [Massilia atriviolacea]|uniref:Type VI secretion system lipoprotein TssJ n=1 Tax=Massilia atriviolacea TaxID=2495579 RepID=A0A430HS72_9BURK|nr:type VI secretion system lipoprotein TssJ [Massilia atriviolacea]RSZ60383.1 type VI secretion system lipoprotein TssJ [Massilia atriviolacea]
MQSISSFIGSLITVAAAIILSACASSATTRASPYRIDFQAARDVNADSRQRPSPVQVKVYALRSPASFQSGDFFALQNQADTVLGKDLIEMEQMVLAPGESRSIKKPGNPDIAAIGIVAEYRLLEKNKWREIITVPDPKQLNTFKFWQTLPDQFLLQVGINKGGIELIQKSK